jgi:hypothetical protein
MVALSFQRAPFTAPSHAHRAKLGAGTTSYIHADLRDTASILSQARELLDFTQPVAISLVAILHAIPGSDHPRAIVARLLDAVPSGSYLAMPHIGSDLIPAQTPMPFTLLAVATPDCPVCPVC